MSARSFLGAGDVYVSRYNDTTGLFGAMLGPFESNKFEIKPKVKQKDATSKGRATYGQVIESVSIAEPTDFAIEFTEVNKETMALAILGTSSVFTQALGAWIDAPITVTAKGGFIPLGKQNVTAAGFLLKNSAGTTTYVLGIDYELNTRLGWVKILPASAILVGATVKVTGAYGAVSGTSITGSTNTQLRLAFFFDGINQADNLPAQVDVYEAVMSPNAAFDFLGGDFGKIPLTGSLKTPEGRTEPFVVRLLDSAL
jgi:hypothetical protein